MISDIWDTFRILKAGRLRFAMLVRGTKRIRFDSILTGVVGNTYYQGGGQWACCTTTKAGCQNLPVACLNGDLIYRATASGGSGFISGSLVTRPW